MRKPKAKKLPKRPAQKSSVGVWERYEKRKKDIIRENDTALRKYELDKKKKEAIIQRTRK